MSFPQPEITPLNAPHWDGLRNGQLLFQRCTACQHAWLPAREACPRCLAPSPLWQQAVGDGVVVSWVVYHVAYDDAFRDRLPYDVTCVQLSEGPRLLTNVIDSQGGKRLRIGRRVHLCIEREGDLALARFKLIEPD